MKTHPVKSVRRYSDQYHCSHCGKQWDVNDIDPPPCKTHVEWLKELKDKVRNA